MDAENNRLSAGKNSESENWGPRIKQKIGGGFKRLKIVGRELQLIDLVKISVLDSEFDGDLEEDREWDGG